MHSTSSNNWHRSILNFILLCFLSKLVTYKKSKIHLHVNQIRYDMTSRIGNTLPIPKIGIRPINRRILIKIDSTTRVSNFLDCKFSFVFPSNMEVFTKTLLCFANNSQHEISVEFIENMFSFCTESQPISWI